MLLWFASQARKGGVKVIKKTEKEPPRSHTPLDLLFDLLSWVMGRAVDLLAASIQRLVYAIVKPMPFAVSECYLCNVHQLIKHPCS